MAPKLASEHSRAQDEEHQNPTAPDAGGHTRDQAPVPAAMGAAVTCPAGIPMSFGGVSAGRRTRAELEVVRGMVSRIAAAAPTVSLGRRVCRRCCTGSCLAVTPVNFYLLPRFALKLDCGACGRQRAIVLARLETPHVFLRGRWPNGRQLPEDLQNAISRMLAPLLGRIQETRPTSWEVLLEETVADNDAFEW